MEPERGRERLLRILEEIRSERYSELSGELVESVGKLEERNQFADDRRQAVKELRELIGAEVRRLSVKEEA